VRAAKKSGAAAGVVAISKKKGKRVVVALVVVDGKGNVLLERELASDDAPGAVASSLAPLAAKARAAADEPVASAPPEPEPPAATPDEPAAEEASASSSSSTGSSSSVEDGTETSMTVAPARRGERSMLSVQAGLQLGGRRLAYNDQLTSNLRPYELFGAPLVALGVSIDPLAAKQGLLGGVGVDASYARAFALSSESADGMSADTSWSRLDVGVHLTLGGAGQSTARLGLGYTRIAFDVGPSMMGGDVMPSVDYQAMRAGGQLRVPSGKLALVLSGGYLMVMSAGGVGDSFDDADTAGLDLGAGIGWRLGGHLEARLDLGYTRIFYALNPSPGDLYVAGGALDELFVLGLGVAYAY
jgi:hypothetical protein